MEIQNKEDSTEVIHMAQIKYAGLHDALDLIYQIGEDLDEVATGYLGHEDEFEAMREGLMELADAAYSGKVSINLLKQISRDAKIVNEWSDEDDEDDEDEDD